MSSSVPPVHTGLIRVLKQAADPKAEGPVVYCMFRDQRLRDNWALIHAVHQANQWEVPGAIAFNLFRQFKGAKAQQLGFMLRDLKELHYDLQSTLEIPFFLFNGWRERSVFGKIQYMNYAGCKRKFDVDGYIAYVKRIVGECKKRKAKAQLNDKA